MAISVPNVDILLIISCEVIEHPRVWDEIINFRGLLSRLLLCPLLSHLLLRCGSVSAKLLQKILSLKGDLAADFGNWDYLDQSLRCFFVLWWWLDRQDISMVVCCHGWSYTATLSVSVDFGHHSLGSLQLLLLSLFELTLILSLCNLDSEFFQLFLEFHLFFI